MSAPVRFLAVVVIGWAGIRAATLGAIPGFTVSYAKEVPSSRLPPIVTTQFPPLPPAQQASLGQQWPTPQYPMAYLPVPATPSGIPYFPPYGYAAASAPIAPRPNWQLPSQSFGARAYDSQVDSLGDWQLSNVAGLPPALPTPRQSTPVQVPITPRLDRVQLSSWALLRGAPSPGALASSGNLGGSQAGARLTYNFNRWLAASLRTSSPVGGSRGAEAAAGVKIVPFRSIPVAITAERRQSISPHGGGRSAFALFAEGGVYRRPLPWKFNLDAYMQAGVVGLKSRDFFADGALAVSRPVWGRFSAGFGVWGGFQPGIYRLDAGPRISIRVRDNIYAHVDWRQRLAGSAQPSSGPALTLAADF